MTAPRRLERLARVNRRTWLDRAFDALGWLLSRAVVGVALAVVTWVTLDVAIQLLIAAGTGDPWAVLIAAVLVALGLGWCAGRVEGE